MQGATLERHVDVFHEIFLDSIVSNRTRIARVLIERSSGIEARDSKTGFTGLHLAAKIGNTFVLRMMLHNGADIDFEAFDGSTALFWAAKYGQRSAVELLLTRGANSGHRDLMKRTPLMAAIFGNATETAEILMEASKDFLNAKMLGGFTALHIAVQECSLAIVDLLLSTEAIVIEAKSEDGSTPLYLAAFKGFPQIVKSLLDSGADPDTENNRAWSPILVAAANGHVQVVFVLIRAEANIEERTRSGKTALSLASEFGHVGVAKILLENGARIDGLEPTPLFLAAKNGHIFVVDLLLEHGADASDDALEATQKNGHELVATLLEKAATEISTSENHLQ